MNESERTLAKRAKARERYARYRAARATRRSFDGRYLIDPLPDLLNGRGTAFMFYNPANNRSFTLRIRTF